MRIGAVALSVAAVALAAAPAALAKVKPDLSVRSVSKPPASVERTAGFDVTSTVRNAGGSAKASKTSFYLSRSTRKARGAIRLKPDQAVPKLKARASAVSTTTLVVPASVALGSYHLIACADATRKVRERSEANNCKAAPGTIKITTAKKPPAGKSSSELIDAAVAAHKLSAETGQVYKVFALFDDPQLPPEFRGGAANLPESLLLDLKPKLSSMSAKARSQLAPFYVPPYHAGSWWAAREGAAAPADPGLSAQDANPPCKALRDSGPFRSWSSYITDSHGPAHFEVWYQDAFARTDDARAKKFVAQLESTIFPELMKRYGRAPLTDDGSKKLCRGGDDNIDIAMVDIGRSITIPYDDCQKTTSAFILLNRRNTVSDVAHEVAHVFQYAFTNAKDCDSYDWWREADATDAEDQVYPKLNADGYHDVEQYNAHYLLDDPSKPLEFYGDEHQYGAYLFPFFLRRMLGKSGVVQQIWENDGKYDSLQAVNFAIGAVGDSSGFEGAWPKFALYNWNQDQFNYYEQTDDLVSHAHRSSLGGAIDDSARISVTPDAAGNKLLTPFVGLDHLSARYYDFNIAAGARTLAFSSFMTTPGHIEALGRFGSWYDLGDWSISLGANPQYFCRDLPAERLEELVLIASNSSYDPNDVLKPDTNYPPTVVATNIGCKKWTGTFSGTEHWANGGGQDITATWSGSATFERDPQFPTVLRLTSASMTWSKSGTLFSTGDTSCSESAGPAQLTAEAGDGEVDLGVTYAKDPRRYDIQILHVDDVPATMTCSDGGGGPFTEHPDPGWLGTVGNGTQMNHVKPSGTASGDSTENISGGGVITWHWTFNPG